MSAPSLIERIQRGQEAIGRAKAEGRDVKAWENHLENLKREAQADINDDPIIEQIIDDKVTAILIDSTILGAPIWFALRDGWRPDEVGSIPVFYASELPALRMKTREQLRSIFNVKRGFGGGRLRQ